MSRTYHGRVLAWLRRNVSRRPGRADGALAVLLAALSAGQWAGDPAAAAVSVLLAATAVPRRRYPVAAFAAAMAIGSAQLAFGLGPAAHAVPPVHALEPNVTDLTIAVLLYTLAARRSRRLSLAGLAACLIGSAVAVARWAPAQTAPPGSRCPPRPRSPVRRWPPGCSVSRLSAPANCGSGGPAWSTSPRPGCAGSSATCTTGPRSAWPRWP
jgi:hypothetical protein